MGEADRMHEALRTMTERLCDVFEQARFERRDGYDLLVPLYLLQTAAVEGLEYYLGRVDGRDVSTSVGYTVDDTVGVFNVATPAEHRGRGYGAALTTQAAREGFAAGADLAWLQSSAMGFSVYRRLGFREAETYALLTRPSPC